MIQRFCKTCKHWRAPDTDERWRVAQLTRPIDPDTMEPMGVPFEVRECAHPAKTFFERGFGLLDGSEYMAALVTAEYFGCVRHEDG